MASADRRKTVAIAFQPDGSLTGAGCRRSDGTPVGVGYARPGIRFRADAGTGR